MPLPKLTVGLVVRYEYLWHRRSLSGATGAEKDHPACVVSTFRMQGRPEDFVIYLPISHAPPSGDEVGIELPDEVKRKARLDNATQWVLVSECNIDAWPYDLRPIANRPGMFHYGHLPPSMFNIIRDAFIKLYRAKRTHMTKRPNP